MRMEQSARAVQPLHRAYRRRNSFDISAAFERRTVAKIGARSWKPPPRRRGAQGQSVLEVRCRCRSRRRQRPDRAHSLERTAMACAVSSRSPKPDGRPESDGRRAQATPELAMTSSAVQVSNERADRRSRAASPASSGTIPRKPSPYVRANALDPGVGVVAIDSDIAHRRLCPCRAPRRAGPASTNVRRSSQQSGARKPAIWKRVPSSIRAVDGLHGARPLFHPHVALV